MAYSDYNDPQLITTGGGGGGGGGERPYDGGVMTLTATNDSVTAHFAAHPLNEENGAFYGRYMIMLERVEANGQPVVQLSEDVTKSYGLGGALFWDATEVTFNGLLNNTEYRVQAQWDNHIDY